MNNYKALKQKLFIQGQMLGNHDATLPAMNSTTIQEESVESNRDGENGLVCSPTQCVSLNAQGLLTIIVHTSKLMYNLPVCMLYTIMRGAPHWHVLV